MARVKTTREVEDVTITCDLCEATDARFPDGTRPSGGMRECRVCGADVCYWHTHSEHVDDPIDANSYDYGECDMYHYEHYCLSCWESGKRQRRAIAKLRKKVARDLKRATCGLFKEWIAAAQKAKKVHEAPKAKPWAWEAEVAAGLADCTTTSTTDEDAELFVEDPDEDAKDGT